MQDYRWKKINVGDIVTFKKTNKVKSRYRGYIAKVLDIVNDDVLFVSCRGLTLHCSPTEVQKNARPVDNMGARVEVISNCKSKGRVGTVVETRYPGYNTRVIVQLDAISGKTSRKMSFEMCSLRGV